MNLFKSFYLLFVLSLYTIMTNAHLLTTTKEQNGGLTQAQQVKSEFVQPTLPRAYNQVIVGSNSMPSDRIYDGADRLEYLLGFNTKNKELLQEMNKFFQKYDDFDWHLTLEHTSAGEVPEQFVYYQFDRGNSELFVGGYKRC